MEAVSGASSGVVVVVVVVVVFFFLVSVAAASRLSVAPIEKCEREKKEMIRNLSTHLRAPAPWPRGQRRTFRRRPRSLRPVDGGGGCGGGVDESEEERGEEDSARNEKSMVMASLVSRRRIKCSRVPPACTPFIGFPFAHIESTSSRDIIAMKKNEKQGETNGPRRRRLPL